MRPDMSRVIVERPRLGGGNTRRGREVPEEMQSNHEGMRAPHVRHYGGKQLNEYLSPLYRFLRSRVGTNWDQVWSEISAQIRATNPLQQHVRDHVLMWVCTKTKIGDDGEVWLLDGMPSPLHSGFSQFYVHPTTGNLEYNEARESWKQRWRAAKKRQEQERQEVARTLEDGTELRKHEGIWYSVTLSPVPKPEMVDSTMFRGYTRKVPRAVPVYDVLLKRTITETHGTYVSNKRQLSHKELKQYGVTNG